MSILGSRHYRMGRLQWRPMTYYWPDDLATDGPAALFAWREGDQWRFGFGRGQRPAGADPIYVVGDWRVHPECFAYVQPPRKR